MDCPEYRDQMLEVLYGEADPAAAQNVEQHLRKCSVCRTEMEAWRAVRRQLAAWKLPSALASPLPARRAVWRTWGGLAAAATLILAVGGALGLSRPALRYEGGALSLRFGGGEFDADQRLAAFEQRHLEELQQLRARPASMSQVSMNEMRSVSSPDEQAMLVKVRQMIHESEGRQALAFNASLEKMSNRMDYQRRYDLARFGTGLSFLQAQSGENLARTTELINYMMQSSDRR